VSSWAKGKSEPWLIFGARASWGAVLRPYTIGGVRISQDEFVMVKDLR